MALRVGVVADRDPENPNHLATEAALEHAGDALGLGVAARWFATDAVEGALDALASCDGLWCTTGSPYRSLAGALRAIGVAREREIPFLGTCAGFQHAVLEYARNVLGLRDAAHGEYPGGPDEPLIAPLACSLAGQWFELELREGSRAARCYGARRVREKYFCSYGIHPRFEAELVRCGLPIVGTADDGSSRVLELPGHRFFVATLFVPQARSAPRAPHPLVTGFLRAAAQA